MTQELDLFCAAPVAISAHLSTSARAIGLVGASGSGKTSLLNMIAGLLPAKGRLVIGGHVLQDDTAGICLPAYRRQIGYAFQESRLFPHFNVQHNLEFGARLRHKRDPARLEEICRALNLTHLLKRKVGNLSGGERQRVALGRAILSAPNLLLLDEPLAHIDEAGKAETLAYIEKIREITAVPMIYVSHDSQEVARMAEIIFTMQNGTLLPGGTSK